MKKIIYLIILVVVVYFGVSYFNKKAEVNPLLSEAKILCGDEHVEWVGINATMIKTISNLPGGGSVYFRADGTSFVCPVVGPDSQTQECKDAAAVTDWTLVCPTE